MTATTDRAGTTVGDDSNFPSRLSAMRPSGCPKLLADVAGSLMFVPAGTPHAFHHPSDEPAVMLFQAAPAGHEDYFGQLAALLRVGDGAPDTPQLSALRMRHDNITVNAVCPGIIKTPLHEKVAHGLMEFRGQSEDEVWDWFDARTRTRTVRADVDTPRR